MMKEVAQFVPGDRVLFSPTGYGLTTVKATVRGATTYSGRAAYDIELDSTPGETGPAFPEELVMMDGPK